MKEQNSAAGLFQIVLSLISNSVPFFFFWFFCCGFLFYNERREIDVEASEVSTSIGIEDQGGEASGC